MLSVVCSASCSCSKAAFHGRSDSPAPLRIYSAPRWIASSLDATPQPPEETKTNVGVFAQSNVAHGAAFPWPSQLVLSAGVSPRTRLLDTQPVLLQGTIYKYLLSGAE